MNPAGPVVTPYCGAAPLPGEIWRTWNFDPPVILGIALLACLWIPLRATGSAARQTAFLLGVAALFIAFLSPLCALSSGLFSARSAHHLLLVAAAAPLLAFAAPRFRNVPVGAAAAAHVPIFWMWHLPAAYAAALSDDALYWTMELSLLGSGVLFWSAFFQSRSAPAQTITLLTMVAQMGLLGAILTFAPEAIYAPHIVTASTYGLTPLEDQQLAGLTMWVVSLPFYLAAGLPALCRSLGSFGRAAT